MTMYFLSVIFVVDIVLLWNLLFYKILSLFECVIMGNSYRWLSIIDAFRNSWPKTAECFFSCFTCSISSCIGVLYFLLFWLDVFLLERCRCKGLLCGLNDYWEQHKNHPDFSKHDVKQRSQVKVSHNNAWLRLFVNNRWILK